MVRICFLHFLFLLWAQTPKHRDLDCGTSWLCVPILFRMHTLPEPCHTPRYVSKFKLITSSTMVTWKPSNSYLGIVHSVFLNFANRIEHISLKPQGYCCGDSENKTKEGVFLFVVVVILRKIYFFSCPNPKSSKPLVILLSSIYFIAIPLLSSNL